MGSDEGGLDNFRIELIAQGKPSLRQALEIAFRHNAPGGKMEGWAVSKVDQKFPGLVLLWSLDDVVNELPNKLPFKMGIEGAAEFVWSWLQEQDYGPEPDHDGDNGKGWMVYTDGWGHVGVYRYAICAVFPAWAMYGK